LPIATDGCAVLAGAVAGVLAHDEITEDDGKVDPLEEARGVGDGKN
jgi:hypothetical protein